MDGRTYSGLLVTSFPTIQGVRFTEESIKTIFHSPQYNLPVTINFGGTTVGIVRGFDHTTEGVNCTFTMYSRYDNNVEDAYIVPGLENVKHHMEGSVRVIDSGDLTEVSISLLPADKHLTPIRLKGE